MPDDTDDISRSDRLEKLYDQERNPGKYGMDKPSLLSPRSMRDSFSRSQSLKREMASDTGERRRASR